MVFPSHWGAHSILYHCLLFDSSITYGWFSGLFVFPTRLLVNGAFIVGCLGPTRDVLVCVIWGEN